MKQFVYSFVEGSKEMKALLGSKGANLAEMTRIGLPVPFGFTITTESCSKYYEDDKVISKDLSAEIFAKLEELETVTGKGFGAEQNPLLVSVRPDSALSEETEMSSVLNLGLNDNTVKGLSEYAKDECFAYDCYGRFISGFGSTVRGIPTIYFENILKELRTEKKYAKDRELQTEDLKALVSAYKALVFELSGKEVPQNPKEQLLETVCAMFEKYDRLKSDGLAINVQAMVFGNIGEDSCIGDACTRNPETGEDEIFGFFLRGGQGYDWKEKGHFVQPISELETAFPEIYQSFVKIGGLLERHYTDVQEMEFVIEKNRLYMLNTTDSRRTAAAALKTAVALEKEEIIDRKTALTRLTAVQIEEILIEIIRADGSSNLSEDFSTLMKWADEIRMLKVRVNADNPAEIECAVQFGAEGIGLYRTEKMFSAEECRNALKDLMFSLSEDKREQAASYLREYQKNEFKKIFEMIGDRPAAIRLIDSLPYGEDSSLPRYRGCRIAIAHPEIAKLQTEALITAAIELKRETGIETMPEIMIPMVGCEKEFASVKNMVAAAAGQCFENEGESIDYIIGPMIEVPRAALVADELARNAEFFSFGTNDLTQTTFGLYRNDDGIVIKEYQEKCIFEQDPFITIDKNGVGRLIRMAAELGKSARSNLKLGLCGEQAGDLESVEFCHQIGLHYISCPPEMIPIAKFAAACAAVRQETERGE